MAPRRRQQSMTAPLDFPQQGYLIEHQINGAIVPQRPRDGYINATRLCQQAGKLFGHYRALARTNEFLEVLSLDIGIPISKLIQSIRGRGDRVNQGTWVHPQVAVNLAQWLSPEFDVQVSRWVYDWASGRTHDFMPVHVRRYLINRSKIPHE